MHTPSCLRLPSPPHHNVCLLPIPSPRRPCSCHSHHHTHTHAHHHSCPGAIAELERLNNLSYGLRKERDLFCHSLQAIQHATYNGYQAQTEQEFDAIRDLSLRMGGPLPNSDVVGAAMAATLPAASPSDRVSDDWVAARSRLLDDQRGHRQQRRTRGSPRESPRRGGNERATFGSTAPAAAGGQRVPARGGGGGGGGGRGSARPASAHPRTRYSPAEGGGGREGDRGDREGEGKSVGSGVGDSAAGLMGSALESKTGGRDYGAALAGSPKRDAGRGGGSSGDGDSDCGGGGVLGETDDSQAFPERGPGLPPATVTGATRGPGLPPATVAGAKRGPGLPPATGPGGALGSPPLPLAVEPQRPPVALAPPQASVEPIVASSSSSSSSSSVAVLAAASGDSASQIQAEMRDMLIFMRRSQEQQAEAMRRHIDHIESRMQVRDESRLGRFGMCELLG